MIHILSELAALPFCPTVTIPLPPASRPSRKPTPPYAEMFYGNDLGFSRQITLEDTKKFDDPTDALYESQKEFGLLLEDSL